MTCLTMHQSHQTQCAGIRRALSFTLLAAFYLSSSHAQAAEAETQNDAPWFGLTLPPAFQAHQLPAIVGERGPTPAMVPADEAHYSEFAGETIWQDLETVVAFSKQSRDEQEIGNGQLWGRISGFPSAERTIEWMVERYQEVGIAQTAIQPFDQAEDAGFWLPHAWEVRIQGNDAFGPGSQDIVLETAHPLSPSELPEGRLSGELIYVGTGSPAELAHIDVNGKIAVQHITPQAHLVFERANTVPRTRDMFARGALAVIIIVDQPGNEMARDFNNCGGPCFNVGGRDGHFLAGVLNAAAANGVSEPVRADLSLDTETYRNLSAINGIGVIPGKDSEETIIINAHADAWFDGAGDNGDGVAVQIALAKHFAKPENRPSRTLVFVASAGHHSRGLNGPSAFVRMNPELAENAVLAINIEHVAQRNFSPARSEFEDGYREFIADSGEAPIVAGITNSAPFLENLFVEGVDRYGTNFVSDTSIMASGEGGGYRSMGAPIVTTMQAPPLYHTSGEVIEAVSMPGLERMARFLAFFIKAVDQAPGAQIDP